MDALMALLLQTEWGVDEALDDDPVDRISRTGAAPARSPHAPPQHAPAAACAVDIAGAATTIDGLRAALAAFRACALAITATNLVFADGHPGSGVVIVDDVPGPEEDLSGTPMSGPAGRLLDRMLASIGLDRTSVLVTNLIPWRPPGGRPPTEAERGMCLPFLCRHLTLLQPRIIVTLGAAPAQALAGQDAPLRKLRGRWQKVAVPGLGDAVALMPMAHPSALLTTPAAKREAWMDLLALQRSLTSV